MPGPRGGGGPANGDRSLPMRVSSRTALLGLIAALALTAASLVGFSGAALTTSASGLSVTVSGGTLDLHSTRDGQAIVLGTTGLRPGDVRDGVVTVSNSGDVAGALTFAVQGPPIDVPASPALSSVLRLKVESCTSASPSCPGATPIGTEDTLAALASGAPLTLPGLASGDSATYRLTLTWPATATDPGLQGASTSVNLNFTARSGS